MVYVCMFSFKLNITRPSLFQFSLVRNYILEPAELNLTAESPRLGYTWACGLKQHSAIFWLLLARKSYYSQCTIQYTSSGHGGMNQHHRSSSLVPLHKVLICHKETFYYLWWEELAPINATTGQKLNCNMYKTIRQRLVWCCKNSVKL